MKIVQGTGRHQIKITEQNKELFFRFELLIRTNKPISGFSLQTFSSTDVGCIADGA